MVLVIDPRAVDCEVRFEWSPKAAEVFPHIYGPVALSAVVEVLDLPSGGEVTRGEWWRELRR